MIDNLRLNCGIQYKEITVLHEKKHEFLRPGIQGFDRKEMAHLKGLIQERLTINFLKMFNKTFEVMNMIIILIVVVVL